MSRLVPAVLLAAMVAPTAALAADVPNSVDMDLAEFLRLYEQAKNRPDKPTSSPNAYAIGSARYQGEVLLDDGEPTSAVFTGKLHVEVLDDKNWVKVPLLPVSTALRSAKIGGAEASVVTESGWYWLVTNKKGAFDIDLAFAAAVESYVGASGINFELAPSGATEVTLAVPSSDALDFKVANAKVKTDRTENGKRIVDASIPSTSALSITWQREVKSADTQASRVYAQVYTLVGIGDGVVQSTTTIDNTILFAGVQTLKEKIPEGSTLLDVKGTGIRDWRLGDDRTLTVDLNYAAEGNYTLTLEMERVIGAGDAKVDAPLVVPVGVERSKGWVGVEARGNLEIGGGAAPKNATTVDVRTLPAQVVGITANPVLLGYKYLGTDVQIPLQVEQHENVDVLVTVIDQARATTMFTQDGRRLTSVQYDVRNNRTQFLKLALPANAELWSASVAGKAVQPAKGSDGRVLLPLVRSSQAGGALAGFQVEVVYVENGEAPSAAGTGTFRAELPKTDVPATYLGWTVYAPADAKVKQKSFAGTVRDVDYLSFPMGASNVTTIDTYTPDMQASAGQQMQGGSLGQGAAPVQVRLPLEGLPYAFEKVLVLDEDLWVSFDYKGLKD